MLLKSGEGFQDAGKGDGKNFKLVWGIYTPGGEYVSDSKGCVFVF